MGPLARGIKMAEDVRVVLQQMISDQVRKSMKDAIASPEFRIAITEAVRSLLTGGISVAGPTASVAEEAVDEVRGRGRPKTHFKCAVIGCEKDYRAKGYCQSHYQQARMKNWPLPPKGPIKLENGKAIEMAKEIR
jgi:hypothetical protein